MFREQQGGTGRGGLPGGILLGVVLAAAGAFAGEVRTALYSAQVWRGQVRNEQPVVETAAAVAPHPDLLIAGQVVFDISGGDPATESLLTRTEFTLAYRPPPLGVLRVELGLSDRRYPGADPERSFQGLQPGARRHAVEGTLSLMLDTFLAPCVDFSFDIRATDGFYTSVGLGHIFASAAGDRTLEIAAALGFGNAPYNRLYYALDEPALSDGTLGLLFRQALAGSLYLTLEAAFSHMFDPRVREIVDTPDALYGGAGVEFRF